jgi:NodT family efflux transporter outer membrane factor (OMF) lipoprotein
MVAAACASASLSACTVHEPGFEPPLDMPISFAATPDAASDTPAPPPPRWWRSFDDDQLDELQTTALDRNFDLATFRDRLRAARAIVRRERSFLFPTLDYSLSASQTRRESGGFDPENAFSGALIGSYDIDAWGRNEALADAADFDRAFTEEQLKAAAIALSAELARTWYALIEQRAQAAVLDDQIETNEQVLRVVRARFGGGVVRASDVLRQERLLESTREQRAAVRANVETLEHAVLVLTGRTPTGELDRPAASLPPLPARPSLGLPAELVQRRPDIRARYFAIRAADRDIAAAVADQFPRITIGAEASTAADQFADLYDDWAATLAADILGPIFDAERRRSEVERTRAVKAEQINAYAQTVLVAFRQVVDALANENARAEQIDRIQRQLELANRTTERLNREYLNGDIPYIDVLDALTTEQQLQRDLLSTRFLQITDRIDLHEAIAGGWDGIVPTESRTATTARTTDTSKNPS